MRLEIYFFASHRDVVGTDTLELVVPDGTDVLSLQALLGDRYPRLQPLLSRSRAAVNEEYVSPEQLLHEGDRVALIPPVSGG